MYGDKLLAMESDDQWLLISDRVTFERLLEAKYPHAFRSNLHFCCPSTSDTDYDPEWNKYGTRFVYRKKVVRLLEKEEALIATIKAKSDYLDKISMEWTTDCYKTEN